MPNTTPVNWHAYAEVYDLMAVNNPAYQELIMLFKRTIATWQLDSHSEVADLGAGTGNFSLELARSFPACAVTHLDANWEMNQLAKHKAAGQGIKNLQFVTADIWAATFQANSQSAITSVHALYAFPRPKEVIAKMFEWLKPGGYLFVCDPGRMGNVADWVVFLFRDSYRRQGLWRTIQLFHRGRIVTKQNRLITQGQKDGVYWSHTCAEFRTAIESVGFEILTAQETYRGASDLVVAQKPH
jgi:ubiquinone/menaquinone biosynthesis C-methylase UbiE